MLKTIKVTVWLLITLATTLLFSGCANNTTTEQYRQADGYQYLERKITDNYFMLDIISKNKANLNTYISTQASVLTDQMGFDWYIIVEQNDAENKKTPYKQSVEIRMGKGIKP
ncbi:hypothetical protein [Shewanella ulleungensis]|jgi:hypothetical protein|uniref:hypothetical protein n=1 Tax=Shewanella ulleungensis TaxID=2282699 RepID=UPI003D7A4EB7